MAHKILLKIKFAKNPLFIIPTIIIIAFIGYFIFREKDAPLNGFTAVRRADLIQEVNVTGIVRPAKSIELAFEKGGKIVNVYADVGDRVAAGQIIAREDDSELAAQL